jgi:hypothetical protein
MHAERAGDLDRRCSGVIFSESFVRNANTREEAFEWQLMLNDFRSTDTAEWGLDVSAAPWWPTKEDTEAVDWEVHEVWS